MSTRAVMARLASVALALGIAVWMTTVALAVSNASTPLPDAAIALRGSVPPAFGLFGLLDCTLAAAIIIRRPENRLGRYLFAVGLAADVAGFAFEYAVFGLRTAPGSVPAPSIAAGVAATSFVPIGLLLAVLPPFIFPSGHLPSAAWRVPFLSALAAVVILATATAVMPGPYLLAPFAENPFGVADAGPAALTTIIVGSGVGGAALVFGLGALIVRYRRSSQDERQQLKWFIYAAAATAAFDQLLFVSPTSMLSEPAVIGTILAATLVPAAMTVAILRYRLYDIDVLIRRTLVYGATTAGLAIVFFGGVLVVQAAIRPFTSGNELAIAASTLATVALFQPLRARVRSAVDRRFYRSRYDMSLIVDSFALRLSGEVDLDAVRSDLLESVDRTVRPVHASVWLRR